MRDSIQNLSGQQRVEENIGLQVAIRTRHSDIHYVGAVKAVKNRFQAGLSEGFQWLVLEGPLLYV